MDHMIRNDGPAALIQTQPSRAEGTNQISHRPQSSICQIFLALSYHQNLHTHDRARQQAKEQPPMDDGFKIQIHFTHMCRPKG